MSFPLTDKNPKFFYDSNEFTFLQPLVNNVQVIKNELLDLIKQDHTKQWFTVYPHYVKSDNDKSWQVLILSLYGIKSLENADLCKKTSALIFSIPQIVSCDFSSLKANSHIMPHTGFTKTLLRCHLPLVVPDETKCGIRVGDETRHWKEGELMIFDDSFEHEAWNESPEDRVVLMFDIPNPYWGYNAQEISRYEIENLKDKFLLAKASKKQWVDMFEKGVFTISFD